MMLEESSIKQGHITWNIRRLLAELAWQIAPPFSFFLAMVRFFPYWNAIWIVNDEGYNLMKAMLVERGFSLYSQIWSDQAPLLTYLLAVIFRINGIGFITSRYLILVFSCVLVWAVVQYIRITWGKLHAIVGAVILVLLPNFLVASAAVLVGQPSLAFAALAMLALAGWHLKRKQAFLILSAAVMSLSLLTKLFTGFLVPIFLLGLLAAEFFGAGKKKNWMLILHPALLWSLTLLGITLGLGILMVTPAYAAQLILPHWLAARATEYPLNEQLSPIGFYLQPAWPILLAAMVGILVAWKQRRWLAIYPLAWMGSVYLFLLFDKPVWWHHQFLVTVPATILAAGAIGEGLRLLVETTKNPSSTRKNLPLISAGLVCLALICAVRIPDVVQFLQSAQPVRGEERNPAEEKFLRKILQFAPETKWMITDMPMLAFMAGLPVPPDLTVISWKRIAAGDLSEADILKGLREYRPEQVLFGRFSLPTVNQFLSQNYRVIHQRGTTILYIRKDLQK